MDWGTWRVTIHGVTKSGTQLKWLSTHACTQMLYYTLSFFCLFGSVLSHEKFFFYTFFFFWLHSAFIALCGLSLIAVSRAYSFVAVPGLLTVVASLVDHRLQGLQASVVATHGLSCHVACGIFLDQGLNLCLLH